MHLLLRLLAASVMIVQAGGHANTERGKHMEARGTFGLKVTPAEATTLEKNMGLARYETDKAWEGVLGGRRLSRC